MQCEHGVGGGVALEPVDRQQLSSVVLPVNEVDLPPPLWLFLASSSIEMYTIPRAPCMLTLPTRAAMAGADECADILARLSVDESAARLSNTKPTSAIQSTPLIGAQKSRRDQEHAAHKHSHPSLSATKIFVTKISSRATEATLAKYFSRFGAVIKVRMQQIGLTSL